MGSWECGLSSTFFSSERSSDSSSSCNTVDNVCVIWGLTAWDLSKSDMFCLRVKSILIILIPIQRHWEQLAFANLYESCLLATKYSYWPGPSTRVHGNAAGWYLMLNGVGEQPVGMFLLSRVFRVNKQWCLNHRGIWWVTSNTKRLNVFVMALFSH